MTVNVNPVYADLNDEEIAAEQPLTESKMIRLRDNPRSVWRNGATVPAGELQLAEGMRTDMDDDHIIVAASGIMVDGGFGINTVASSDTTEDTGNDSDIVIDLPTVGAFIAWGIGAATEADSEITNGICHVNNNSIQKQRTSVIPNDGSGGSTTNSTAWTISGGKLRMRLNKDLGRAGVIILLRVS